MTLCAAGGGPIAYEPWMVADDDGALVPMCEPHALIVDFGRDLVAALGDGHPLVVRLVAVLDQVMAEPCPVPGIVAVLAAVAVDAPTVPASDEADDELAADLRKFAPFLVGVKP